MKGYCNFIPDTIWVRGTENGLRHITLRRDFTEETIIRQEGEETQYKFEETDVFIPDRDNIEDFVTNNFGNLFDQGLLNENAPVKKTDTEINTDRIEATENALMGLLFPM